MVKKGAVDLSKVFVCDGCGAVVWDKKAHIEFHEFLQEIAVGVVDLGIKEGLV